MTDTPPAAARPLRVVVIDDSAYNRQTIAAMLESDPGIQVVGRAADGDEGLKQVLQIQPDLVTLDLEMPRMDGFTFLRILMSRRPTPVLIVSGWGARENVFKALELGALDFIVKPSRTISPDLRSIREELVAKAKLVSQLRMLPLAERAQKQGELASRRATIPPGTLSIDDAEPVQPAAPAGPAPPVVIAIGASTGGPPALQQVLIALDPRLPAGVLISQHMPPKFTRAFAERLARNTRWQVREAEDGDCLLAGHALVAPGSGSIVVRRDGPQLRVTIEAPGPGLRYVPSVDRMLESAADAAGAELVAAVLTGMGDDGAAGVRRVKGQGGRVLAESADTAVIFGMPQEAIATGAVDEVLPLGKVAEAITRFVESRPGARRP